MGSVFWEPCTNGDNQCAADKDLIARRRAVGANESRNMPTMNCPSCGKTAEPGTAQVHGTGLGFMFTGFSFQPLFFKNAEGVEEKLMEPNSIYEAFLCPSCKTIVIPTKTEAALPLNNGRCPRCEFPNDADANFCEKCGQRVR